VVFLLDVDNTLLDNDRFVFDLGERLEQAFGTEERQRYWAINSDLREKLGYVDYLETLQRFRVGLDDDPNLLEMSAFLLEYPFAERLYRRGLEAVCHLRTMGLTVILSDGDIVFQPRKIQRSGIWEAVEGRVLIFLHKERMLETMQKRYPASHYVMVDDKPNILAAMKRALGEKLTTIFVRQGHYAVGTANRTIDPRPDRSIQCIGDLLDYDLSHFFMAAQSRAANSNQERT
jgi:FMN phosphatase YigB (HAD superfamily)